MHKSNDNSYKFYVFQNEYYIKTSWDLVETNFKLHNETNWQSVGKQLIFSDGVKPNYERVSVKYIKAALNQVNK